MGVSLKRKQPRLGLLAAAIALAVSLGAPAARAVQPAGDKIVERLRQGESAITTELTGLTVASRNEAYIKKALQSYGLDQQTNAAIQKSLGNVSKKDPERWATYYLYMKQLGAAPKATPKAAKLDAQKMQANKLGKGLNLADGDIAGKLDKAFDGKGRFGGAKEEPVAWPGSDNGDGEKATPTGWGSKPPANQGDGKITFDDVVGIDDAKKELTEIVDMIKNPARYRRMGADIPTGILMAGPPGTGKTYTARALANEAGVNFLSMEGSAFIDKYVGESAAKVRKFFEEAREKQPCIVFIDEIEALAGKRVDVSQGADREINGAVTQLLVEMDGLTENPDGTKPLVIVVGATNRIDMLDPAVLRPGRFDRKVIFNLPDVNGRKKLLDLYVKKKKVPTAADYSADEIATRTTGMSPADIKNLVNEAALLAARDNVADPKVDKVEERHFIRAIDRISMGKERNMVMSEKDKKQTAMHELGHALVGTFVPFGDPITKITIIPRDTGAGGVTMSEPAEGDRLYWTRSEFLAHIAMAMGGRVSEQMFFGEITTGPSSDLEQASNIARQMVMQYGMSDEMGPVTFVQNEQGNFLNRGGKLQAVSEATQQKIDSEVVRILREQEKIATAILTKHKATLEKLVPSLITKETLEGKEFRGLINEIEGGNVAKDPTNPGGGGSSNARRLGPTGR